VRQQAQERILIEVGRWVNYLRRAVDNLLSPTGALLREEKIGLSQTSAALAPASYGVETLWPARDGLILSSPQNSIVAIDLDDSEHTFMLTVDGVEHCLSGRAYNDSIHEGQSLLGELPDPVPTPRRSSWTVWSWPSTAWTSA
jgi:hypothetical protein